MNVQSIISFKIIKSIKFKYKLSNHPILSISTLTKLYLFIKKPAIAYCIITLEFRNDKTFRRVTEEGYYQTHD
jgi:hypothetical protein